MFRKPYHRSSVVFVFVFFTFGRIRKFIVHLAPGRNALTEVCLLDRSIPYVKSETFGTFTLMRNRRFPMFDSQVLVVLIRVKTKAS